MKENQSIEFDSAGSGVEYLLEHTQFEPGPDFTAALKTRLRQKVDHSFAAPSPTNKRLTTTRSVWKQRPTWQWLASAVVLVVLAFTALWVTTPPVQAQVAAFFQRFGVRLPFAREGVVISAFRPLMIENAPSELDHFSAHNWCFGSLQDGQCAGVSYTELRYFSQKTFIVIYETPLQPNQPFPAGEGIQIGNQEVVLLRDLSGVVRLAYPAPQTWRVNGNSDSGGGGGGGGSNDAGPRELAYSNAIEIIWNQAGVHIELLTNLPLDQVQHLVESMKTAPALNQP